MPASIFSSALLSKFDIGCMLGAELLALISSGHLHPIELTFAAEIASRLDDSVGVRAALMPLLNHESAVVREGAILGLASHVDDAVRTKLRGLVASDPSAAVRSMAADVLEVEL